MQKARIFGELNRVSWLGALLYAFPSAHNLFFFRSSPRMHSGASCSDTGSSNCGEILVQENAVLSLDAAEMGPGDTPCGTEDGSAFQLLFRGLERMEIDGRLQIFGCTELHLSANVSDETESRIVFHPTSSLEFVDIGPLRPAALAGTGLTELLLSGGVWDCHSDDQIRVKLRDFHPR